MYVYVVLAHTSYEGDTLILVTTDELFALATAKETKGYAYVEVQKWDAITAIPDNTYDQRFD